MRGPSPRSVSPLASIAGAVGVLVGGTAIAQLLGIARELFVASQVGLSPELDALLIALALPLTLAGALSSGTGTALVPAYATTLEERGPRAARRLVGTVLVWVCLAGVILTIALIAFADAIVAVTGLGLEPVNQRQAAGYLRLMAPAALLGAAQGILVAQSQAEERFASIAASTFAHPLVTLVVTVGLWPAVGLDALAIGYLAGPAVGLLVLLAASLHASTLPIPVLAPRGVGVRALTRHATPLTLSAGILQLNVVADRAIASVIGPGAVSALRYGESLVRTPIGAIAPAWGAAIYPALVRASHDPTDRGGLGRSTGLAIRFALVAFVPLVALVAGLAPLGVEFAYGRGAFDASDAQLTSTVVAGFAPLLLVLMVSPILTSAHNALRRGGVLLVTGAANVVLNLLLNLALGSVLGAAGIALSSSITSSLLVVFLAARLHELGSSGAARALWVTLARSVAAMALPAVAITVIGWSGVTADLGIPAVVAVVTLGAAALIVYAGTMLLLGSSEVRLLVRAMLGRLAPRSTRG